MTKELDKGYSWVVLLLCSLIYMLSSASFKNFGILYGQLQQHYNSGSGDTASIGSLAGFLQCVTSSFANALCVRYSFRLVLFIGGLLISLSYLMSGFMSHFHLLYLTFSVIGGFGFGFSLVPSATIINFYFEKRRNLANGVVASSSGFGSLFLPYLYRYIFDQYLHEGAFLLFSGFFLHICVAASLIRQPVILKHTRKQEIEKRTRFKYRKRKGLPSSLDSVLRTFKQFFTEVFNFDWALLKIVPYVLHVIALSLCFLGYTANHYLIPPYIEAIGYEKQNTAFVLSLMGLCEIAGRIVSGWFLDLKIVSAKTFFIFNVMLGALVAGILPLIPSFEYICVYSAIVACFPGSFYTIMPTLLVDEIGLKRLPKAYGIVFLFGAAMYTTGVPILGWLKDKTGTWNLSFHILGCTFFLSAITMIVQIIYSKKKHQTEETYNVKNNKDIQHKENNDIQIDNRDKTSIQEDQSML